MMDAIPADDRCQYSGQPNNNHGSVRWPSRRGERICLFYTHDDEAYRLRHHQLLTDMNLLRNDIRDFKKKVFSFI